MLERLIEEAAERFRLGDQAVPLVDRLLVMITDRDHGRIEGFLDAFREEGLGEQVDSWIAEGPGMELGGQEVATGLGPGLVEEIAQRLGLEPANVAAALGFLIPRVLDLLTPGGEVPGEELLLSRVDGMLAGMAAGAVAEPVVAPPPAAPLPAPTPPTETPPTEAPRRRGALFWLLPLLVLLALAWWAARQCVPEETERQSEAADIRAGRGPSDAGRRPAGRALARGPRSNVAAGPARRDGPAASDVGSESVSEAEPDRVPETETETEARTFDADSAVAEARQAAVQALDDLRPDFTAADLAAVLNRGRIDFAPSSAAISPPGRALLEQAAKAILALQAGTRLEIAGHTDSAGEPRRNQRLSQARAEAVRNVLLDLGVPSAMLVPRGYGASRPVASNDTAEGRIRNRRIEFAVME